MGVGHFDLGATVKTGTTHDEPPYVGRLFIIGGLTYRMMDKFVKIFGRLRGMYPQRRVFLISDSLEHGY